MGGKDLITAADQRSGHGATERLVVIDDQYSCHGNPHENQE
jgi:hypothetical protein